MEGGEGKKTLVTPLVSALRTTPIYKEPAPYKVGTGIPQEMAQDVEEGMERVSANVEGEKDTDLLPPVQIWEKSSTNSRSKGSKRQLELRAANLATQRQVSRKPPLPKWQQKNRAR